MPEAEMEIDVKDQEEFDSLWLVEALRLVHGERAATYGHPAEVYARARAMWMAILGVEVSWTQFCYCLATLKMARELTNPHPDEDNNRDIAGYIGVLNRIKLRLEEQDDSQRTAGGAQGVADEELPSAEAAPAAARSRRRSGGAKPRSPKS